MKIALSHPIWSSEATRHL